MLNVLYFCHEFMHDIQIVKRLIFFTNLSVSEVTLNL